MQGIDVTEGASTVVLNRPRRCSCCVRARVQAVDERIELRFELIKATEVGDDALAHRAGVGAEGLDNSAGSPATGAADTRCTCCTITRITSTIKRRASEGVTLQRFREIAPSFGNPLIRQLASRPETADLTFKLRNLGIGVATI